MSEIQTNTTNPATLEETIDAVLLEMQNHKPYTDQYTKMVEQLDKLYKMRTYKKATSVSMDTVLSVGGSLAGIVLILGYEHAHVVTSKALGFVLKAKL